MAATGRQQPYPEYVIANDLPSLAARRFPTKEFSLGWLPR